MISSQDISINLLSRLKTLLANESWLFSWHKKVKVPRSWRIFAKNIGSLSKEKTKLHDYILETLTQIFNAIITEECYRQIIQGGDSICLKIDLVSQLYMKMAKPLLESYLANRMACVDGEFYIDHLKIRNGGNIEKMLEANLSKVEHGTPAEIVRFNITLCH